MNCGLLFKKKALTEDDLKAQYRVLRTQYKYGQTWIWAAIDSSTRLIVCYLVGNRTLESCRKFLKDLSSRACNIPLFTSDELVHYKTILSEIYSTEIPVEKTGKRGRPRKPIKVIEPDLDYATVSKTREKGKVVKVETNIVFGDEKRTCTLYEV